MLEHHEQDWRKVVAWLTGPIPEGKRIFYQKHMTHHLLPEIDRDWLRDLTHVFLIRDPREMLTSLVRHMPRPTLADTGLPQQVEIFEWARAQTGRVPPVIDAEDVLNDPEGMLARALRGGRGGVHPSHAPLAAGLAGDRRRVGQALVQVRGRTRPASAPSRPSPTRSPAGWSSCTPSAKSITSSLEQSPARRRCGGRLRPETPMLQQFDERNREILINIDGKLLHRDEAGISPFDSAVQGGDAVWEGLRLYQGRIFKLREHLERLRGSALALAFEQIPDDENRSSRRSGAPSRPTACSTACTSG